MLENETVQDCPLCTRRLHPLLLTCRSVLTFGVAVPCFILFRSQLEMDQREAAATSGGRDVAAAADTARRDVRSPTTQPREADRVHARDEARPAPVQEDTRHRHRRDRRDEERSSSDSGEEDPDFPQPTFTMADEFCTMLSMEGVNPRIIDTMERLGCINQPRFAHFLNDKAEIVLLICKPAKVPKNQRRMYAGILAGIWSQAAKKQDLDEKNTASGSARDDIENPLPDLSLIHI